MVKQKRKKLTQQKADTQQQVIKEMGILFKNINCPNPMGEMSRKARIQKTITALLSFGVTQKLPVILPTDMGYPDLVLNEEVIEADFKKHNLEVQKLNCLSSPNFDIEAAYKLEVMELIDLAFMALANLKLKYFQNTATKSKTKSLELFDRIDASDSESDHATEEMSPTQIRE